MRNTNPYPSLTPLPRISSHVPASQRQDVTAEIRPATSDSPTRCVAPLGADGPDDLRFSDLADARGTAVIQDPPRKLPWPLRLAAGGLAVALLPIYLLDRATRRKR